MISNIEFNMNLISLGKPNAGDKGEFTRILYDSQKMVLGTKSPVSLRCGVQVSKAYNTSSETRRYVRIKASDLSDRMKKMFTDLHARVADLYPSEIKELWANGCLYATLSPEIEVYDGENEELELEEVMERCGMYNILFEVNCVYRNVHLNDIRGKIMVKVLQLQCVREVNKKLGPTFKRDNPRLAICEGGDDSNDYDGEDSTPAKKLKIIGV